MQTPARLLEIARQHHQAGNLAAAEPLYRQVLQQQPNDPDALHLLGLIAYQTGRAQEAHDLIRRALAHKPEPAYFNNLGLALKALGRLEEAVAHFQQAVQAQPAFAEAHANLGSALKDLGRLEEAAESLERALQLRPNHPTMPYNLGNVRLLQRRLAEALALYDRALQLKPDYLEALNNRGRALFDFGRLDEALAAYEQALRIQPSFADALVNAALALKRLGRPAEAANRLGQAARTAPGNVAAQRELGQLLQDLGQWHPAVAHLEDAVRLAPADVPTRNRLSQGLVKLGRLDEAEAHSRESLRLEPADAEAHNQLGAALIEQGRVEEAIAAYREAARLQPQWQGAQSNVLLALNYLPSVSPDWLLEQHRDWARSLGIAPFRAHANDLDPERRLKVGYVSPDFRLHPVAHFIEPVLAGHDPKQVEVFAYAEVLAPDDMSRRLGRHVAQWRQTCGWNDEQMADAIRADQIDILVDLAGHTGGNRLPVFARKPAPVQVSWLGYPNTTGLEAIDYRLTDAVADPPAEPICHSEELVRLDQGFCCWSAGDYFPPVTPLPALATGQLTLGCMHNLAKVHPAVLDLWCRVLRALPGSRFLWFRNTLRDATRERIIRRFAECGIGADRLDLRGEATGEWGYLKIYQEMDVVLDAWPWSGHTTACEGLWMGVPVLTLPGNRFAGRMTASILTQLGLDDWIAASEDDYLAKARGVAADLERLARLRGSLRQRMRESPLCDGARFSRCLEDAYRALWRRWCGENSR